MTSDQPTVDEMLNQWTQKPGTIPEQFCVSHREH